jgi:transcriptional regulator with XRE-family HTH domain
MEKNQVESEKIWRHHLFLEKLQKNELQIPNEFTKEMGNLIKKAREEKGLNQSQLAEKLSRSQATISDIENGKIEVSILTLVLIAFELNKPISFFIPEMTFFTNLNDLQNKFEEEALSIFRQLEYEGDPILALRFMKMLLDYNLETQDPGWGIPGEE